MAAVQGKVALVTGAASGIGRATAELLAAEGARLAVADVNEAGGRETVQRIAAKGGAAQFVKLDVTSEAEWHAAVDAVVAHFGRLDILVNNAGMDFVKLIPDTSLAEWRKVMSVNLDGVFLGTQAAIAAMRKSGGGAIVNLSSIAGLNGYAWRSAYCTSKGGVRLLTKGAGLLIGLPILLFLVVLVPLLPIVLVGLVIWLVARSRRRTRGCHTSCPPPAAPGISSPSRPRRTNLARDWSAKS